MRQRNITEPVRKTPIAGSYDLIVVGGGFAGVAAALAGARTGAKTLLLDKAFALGGLGTLGLVVDYLPLCDGNGVQMVGGIGEELLRASIRFGPGKIPECWAAGGDAAARSKHRYELRYAPAPMMIAMEQLLVEAGAEILYDCRFAGCVCSAEKVDTILCETKAGRIAFACKTVVDATGDADVCFSAGEQTIERRDNVCAWWFYSYNGNVLKLNQKTDNFYSITADMPCYTGVDPRSETALAIESRRRVQSYLDGINLGVESAYSASTLSHDGTQAVRDDPEVGSEPVYAAILPMVPEFRMTRRLKAAYELDESDAGVWFEDAVGMTGDWRRRGPRYSVPLSALCAVRMRNLLTAGRCISTTDAGWDIMRVIPVCALTGEAAGTACAMAANGYDGYVDLLPIAFLQSQLRAQGALLEPSYF